MKLAKLKALTKVAVRNMFSEFLSKKTGRLRVGLLILLAVCFLPIAFLAWQFCAVLYQSLAVVGAQQAVPAMAVGVVSLVIFFLSLLMLPGNLYYSKDISRFWRIRSSARNCSRPVLYPRCCMNTCSASLCWLPHS